MCVHARAHRCAGAQWVRRQWHPEIPTRAALTIFEKTTPAQQRLQITHDDWAQDVMTSRKIAENFVNICAQHKAQQVADSASPSPPLSAR